MLFIDFGFYFVEVGLLFDYYLVVFDIDFFGKFKDLNYKFCFDFKNVDFDLLNKELFLLFFSFGVENVKF